MRSSHFFRRSRLARPLPQIQQLEDRTLFSSIAHFDTNMGAFDITLFDAQKPQSVGNFIKVASKGIYANTLVHRSANLAGAASPINIIQGGGYKAQNGLPAVKDPYPNVPDELDTNGLISNTRGTFSYAKSGPNTANTQWFVNVTDNSTDLDPAANSGGFTVFGQVTPDTLSTIDAVAALPTTDLAPGKSTPFTNVPLLPDNSNGVVVNSVTFTQLDVTLGNGGAKSLSFVDGDGTKSTISLNGGGSATIHLTGTNMLEQVKGSRLKVSGAVSGVDPIAVTGSDAGTSLKLTGKGGNGAFALAGITLDGAAKAMALSGVALSAPISVGGSLGSLKISGGLAQNLSAASLGSANIVGDVTGVTLAIPGQVGKINVKGSITNSSIVSNTGITSLSAGALSGSAVYAGLGLSAGLPATASDFTSQTGAIGSLKIKSLVNSDVAAWNLGKLSLGTVTLANNGTPFGVGAHSIAAVSGQANPGGKFNLKNLDSPATLQQLLQSKNIDLMDVKIVLV